MAGGPLQVLDRAEALAVACNDAVDGFPAKFRDLADQIRRAGTSVALNIAEGSGRSSNKEYYRFLDVSRGSLIELRSALRVARGSRLLDEALFDRLMRMRDEVARMLFALMRSVEARIKRKEELRNPPA